MNTSDADSAHNGDGAGLGWTAATDMADNESSRHRIVVGVNGSNSSIDALQWAGRIGAAIGVEIDAVMSWEVSRDHEFSSGPGYRPTRDAERRLTGALAAAFGKVNPAGLRALVRQGRAARVLVEAGKDAEMLVVGSRGHGGIAGLLLGSVSTYCAQHASCPVVVASPRAALCQG
jgi:nucleotide-binding universal stress UspA family protein